MAMFEAPNSTPVGGKHMRPLIFLYKIEFWTTFIRNIFYKIGIFISVQP